MRQARKKHKKTDHDKNKNLICYFWQCALLFLAPRRTPLGTHLYASVISHQCEIVSESTGEPGCDGLVDVRRVSFLCCRSSEGGGTAYTVRLYFFKTNKTYCKTQYFVISAHKWTALVHFTENLHVMSQMSEIFWVLWTWTLSALDSLCTGSYWRLRWTFTTLIPGISFIYYLHNIL